MTTAARERPGKPGPPDSHVTPQPETKFGRLAVRDPRLVHDLRRGRVPGPSICARVAAMLEQR